MTPIEKIRMFTKTFVAAHTNAYNGPKTHFIVELINNAVFDVNFLSFFYMRLMSRNTNVRYSKKIVGKGQTNILTSLGFIPLFTIATT